MKRVGRFELVAIDVAVLEGISVVTCDGSDLLPRLLRVARFFAENLAVQAPALMRIVTEGADAVLAADAGTGAA